MIAITTVTFVRASIEFSLGFQEILMIGEPESSSKIVSPTTSTYTEADYFNPPNSQSSRPLSFTCYPSPSFPCFRMHICIYDLDTWLWPLLWFPSQKEETLALHHKTKPFFQSEKGTGPSVLHPVMGGRVLSRCLLIQHFKFTNKTTLSWMAGSR